jgi:hypothetical protein
MDTNENGEVERNEWLQFIKGGGSLPDYGTGPGHHGSFEVCGLLVVLYESRGDSADLNSRRSTNCITGSSKCPRCQSRGFSKRGAKHVSRYHDENTKEEDLTHPEDIEHFRLHDEMEEEAERIARMDELSIVEKNIPQKFLKD